MASKEKKLNGTVIVTYRCNARCSMCNRYKAPSKPEEELSIETIKKLPKMYFTNNYWRGAYLFVQIFLISSGNYIRIQIVL